MRIYSFCGANVVITSGVDAVISGVSSLLRAYRLIWVRSLTAFRLDDREP